MTITAKPCGAEGPADQDVSERVVAEVDPAQGHDHRKHVAVAGATTVSQRLLVRTAIR